MNEHSPIVLDVALLDELESVLGLEILEVVAVSIPLLTAAVDECDQLAQAPTLASLAKTAHRLKGSAGSLGAVHLTAAAAALERVAQSGDRAATDTQLLALRASAARAVAALGARYPSATAPTLPRSPLPPDRS